MEVNLSFYETAMKSRLIGAFPSGDFCIQCNCCDDAYRMIELIEFLETMGIFCTESKIGRRLTALETVKMLFKVNEVQGTYLCFSCNARHMPYVSKTQVYPYTEPVFSITDKLRNFY